MLKLAIPVLLLMNFGEPRVAQETNLAPDVIIRDSEIAPVAGKTFFAYWEEILYVGFVIPTRNMVVVMSCGRKFCDSDKLYELARKVGSRSS